jgi:hypothetical protein
MQPVLVPDLAFDGHCDVRRGDVAPLAQAARDPARPDDDRPCGVDVEAVSHDILGADGVRSTLCALAGEASSAEGTSPGGTVAEGAS